MVVVECRGSERLLLVKRFFPLYCVRSFRCEFLGISMAVSFRCRHTVVAVDPCLIKSMCLNGRPLVGRTTKKARDPFLLHLTLDSLPEGIILWETSAGVGEANDELIPGNIAIVLMARRFWINEASFRYGHCECRGGRGLMDLNEFFFSF